MEQRRTDFLRSRFCWKTRTIAASYFAILGSAAFVTPAAAADLSPSTVNLGLGQLAQASSPASLPTLVAPPVPARVEAGLRYDPLRLHWVVPLPGPDNTLTRNLFGIGKTLNDAGLGYLAFTNTFFSDNVLRHALPLNNTRGNQLYSGQEPTFTTINYLFLTADLNRYGIPDGQLAVGANYVETNWNPGGPRTTGIATASYYQTLFNRAVEIKAGILGNSVEFLSTFVAGNLAGGIFGPNASIPVEEGENNTVFATPGINVKLNLPSHFYTKVGVQRAISPDGTVVEVNQDPAQVRFKVPNSGVFVIDETGYQVPASPTTPSTWIRAAANYTSSNYREYNSIQGLTPRRGDHEYGLYILGDQQVLQTAPHAAGTAAQGIYVGGSAMYAPPELNRFSQYYEARVYGIGLIPGRPLDLISAVFTDNVFSGYAVRAARNSGQLAHSDSKQFTLAYGAHVYPGVNLNAAISYVDHPTSVTYNGRTGSALNVLFGTVTFF